MASYQLPGVYIIESGNRSSQVDSTYFIDLTSASSNITLSLNSLFSTIETGLLLELLATTLASSSIPFQQNTLSYTVGKDMISNLFTLDTGSLPSSLTKSLLGEAVVSYIGSITPSSLETITRVLTGSSSLLVSGNLLFSFYKDLTNNLLPLQSGSIAKTVDKGLQTSLITSDFSIVNTSISKVLLSSAITIASGNILVYDGSLIKSLSGVSLDAFSGLVSSIRTANIIGTSFPSLTTSLNYNSDKPIISNESIVNQGIIKSSTVRNITSSSILSDQGILLFSNTDIVLSLTGEYFLSYQGQLILLGKTAPSITKVFINGSEYYTLSITNTNTILQTN